jgi:hypothetical protein
LLLPVSILLAITIFTSCSKTVNKSSAKNIIAFYLKNADESALDSSKLT